MSAILHNLVLYAKFNPQAEFLNGKQTAVHLGISTMQLHRLRFGYTDPKGRWHEPVADFPKPYRFAGPESNPLWKLSELDLWAKSRQEAA
jgi:hypothetical protein